MMRKSYLLGFIILLPIVVAIAALVLVSGRELSIIQALDEYQSNGYLVTADNQLIWNIAQDFVRGTEFEDKLRINSSYQSDAINIYVLRDDPQQYISNFACNCSAFVEQKIIVCDASLIEHFTNLLQEPTLGDGRNWLTDVLDEAASPTTAHINLRFSTFLLQWIIGHEIGHVVLEHDVADKDINQLEQEADTFVINQLGQAPDVDELDIAWAWLSLVSVTETMYQYGLSELTTASGPNNTIVTLESRPDIHPPWLVRSLNMTRRVIDNTFIIDNSGYVDEIWQNVLLSEDGGLPPFTFCDAEITPRLSLGIAKLGDSPYEAYRFQIQRGFEYWELAAYEEALTAFTEGIDLALALMQEGTAPPPQLFEAYLQRGVIYFIQENYERALSDWTAIVALEPNEPRAYNNVGFVYYELDRFDEAIHQWEIATNLDPFLDDSWAGLGVAYYATGQIEKAISAYQKAIDLEPRYASVVWLYYERSWTEKSLDGVQALLSLMSE